MYLTTKDFSLGQGCFNLLALWSPTYTLFLDLVGLFLLAHLCTFFPILSQVCKSLALEDCTLAFRLRLSLGDHKFLLLPQFLPSALEWLHFRAFPNGLAPCLLILRYYLHFKVDWLRKKRVTKVTTYKFGYSSATLRKNRENKRIRSCAHSRDSKCFQGKG